MTNYQTGHDAEQIAAQYLTKLGYKILDINWKTPRCEIDIVAEKDKLVFFVEVKSRKSAGFGSGLDYITPKKLEQMEFAARLWMAANNNDGDCRLAALSVDAGHINFVPID